MCDQHAVHSKQPEQEAHCVLGYYYYGMHHHGALANGLLHSICERERKKEGERKGVRVWLG